MLETYRFGRTGHASTRLLFGAAALSNVTQQEADQTMELVMEAGINHIDTANIYGKSQERLGPWMKKYRDRFFLASKTTQRTVDTAMDDIHRALEQLQTDHLDLIQLHGVIEDWELNAAMDPGGALEAAVDARLQGLVRYIGITSHTLSAPVMQRKALAKFDFDSVLLPWNYMFWQNPIYRAQAEELFAICKSQNVAVQIIKTAQRRPWAEDEHHHHGTWYNPFDTQPEIDLAIHWALAQPDVFLNTIGDIHLLPQVIDAANRFQAGPSQAQMEAMVQAQQAEAMWS